MYYPKVGALVLYSPAFARVLDIKKGTVTAVHQPDDPYSSIDIDIDGTPVLNVPACDPRGAGAGLAHWVPILPLANE